MPRYKAAQGFGQAPPPPREEVQVHHHSGKKGDGLGLAPECERKSAPCRVALGGSCLPSCAPDLGNWCTSTLLPPRSSVRSVCREGGDPQEKRPDLGVGARPPVGADKAPVQPSPVAA